MLEIDCRGLRVLIISDLHLPYAHPDWFVFLSAVKIKYLNELSKIISIGDEVDNSAISFHDSPAEGLSPGDELDKAIGEIGRLCSLFPSMKVLESNHGSLIYRKMKHHKLPISYIKPLAELYKTPLWSWEFEILLNTAHKYKTYLVHKGKAGYNAMSKEMGMNVIQGHYHSKYEITWARTATSERYNVFTGCLINYEKLVFEYGKDNVPKPILGVIVIDEFGIPHMVKMNLKGGRWDGKI